MKEIMAIGRWSKALRQWIVYSFLAIAALSSTGCYKVVYDGFERTYVMHQVGIVLRVQNNWAPCLNVESPSQGIVAECIPFGQSRTVLLPSLEFTGPSRSVTALVKGYTKEGTLVGAISKEWRVNVRNGSKEDVWIVCPPQDRCR